MMGQRKLSNGHLIVGQFYRSNFSSLVDPLPDNPTDKNPGIDCWLGEPGSFGEPILPQ